MNQLTVNAECVACGWRGHLDDYETHKTTVRHTRAVLVAAEAAVIQARLMYEEARPP